MPDQDRPRPRIRSTSGARLAREGAAVEDRRADARVVMTYQDYLELPNDGKRYEILDGDPHVTPTPSWYHQRTLFNLAKLVDEFVLGHDLGFVLTAPWDIVLDE